MATQYFNIRQLERHYIELRDIFVRLVRKLNRTRLELETRKQEIIALRAVISRQALQIRNLKIEAEDSFDEYSMLNSRIPILTPYGRTIYGEVTYTSGGIIRDSEEEVSDSGMGSSP